MQRQDIIPVTQKIFPCDGGTEGHPRIYLNFGKDTEMECPYCGQHFVHLPDARIQPDH